LVAICEDKVIDDSRPKKSIKSTSMNDTASVHKLISTIGPGKMPAIAYDTAWAARLGDISPDLSNRALGWICEHQLPDGSWGAAQPFYYHDRVISTLAAMIALGQRGHRSSDKKMVERGRTALNRLIGGAKLGLAADSNGATIGFEMIVPTLVAEARRMGLIDKHDEFILGCNGNKHDPRHAKLKNRISRYITPAFSAEMAGTNTDMLNIDELPELNGSIAYSPAATAYFALSVRPGDPKSLAYLGDHVTADGGMPNVAPFDIFEVAWTLWNLALTNPGIRHDPMIARHVDFLRHSWQPGHGVGFAAGYSVFDGDESAFVLDTLKEYGVDVDIDAVLTFETDDHFRCYDLEADPSTSTHAHILAALRKAGMPADAPSVKKVLGFLVKSRNQAGIWFDKWHLSPYYVTCHTVIACNDYAPEIILQAVDWILATQKADGSWGLQMSTAEETAYCIQALWIWAQAQTGPNAARALAAIKRALPWLNNHAQPPYPPLWIGKGLYCPENVIRSAILSALALAGA
jgi:halimadienyl-diphosphate synthase